VNDFIPASIPPSAKSNLFLTYLRAVSLTSLLGLAASCSTPSASTSPAATPAPTPAPKPAAPAAAKASFQTAGELIVSLDARDPSAGTTTWINHGSMGNFSKIGTAKLTQLGGLPTVQFNGTTDAYRSEKSVPESLTGAHARTIEVWVNNPTLDSTEECMVSWGHRGLTLGNLAFNYGATSGFNAVTHYDQDMTWGDEPPTPGQWHYLVYTYDGTTGKIYDNATERGSQGFTLATAADTKLNIAVENGTEGQPLFQSEFDDNWPLSLSGNIAIVRVDNGALTPTQVKSNFDSEKGRFGVSAP
jgi:Concanavalin A-like lectin/glucanases superfamily